MNHRFRCAGLIGLIVLLARTPALTEVSTDGSGPFVDTLILGVITDDVDPVGIWLQHRPIAPNRVLNPSGYARGDGRPDLAFKSATDDPNPIGAWPVVVWAYNLGIDHDIAFSEWDGSEWTTTEFLTSGTTDELDPRVFVEPDGTVHVVWWTADATEKVYLSTRSPGSSTWDLPVLVTEGLEEGRRPSVVVSDDELRVAYERDSSEPGMAQDVIVATQQPGGSFTFEVVGSTARTDRLDVMIHTGQDHLWAEWKHEAGEFGCAEHQSGSGWIGNGPEPWIDPSWVGVEETRKAVRAGILE